MTTLERKLNAVMRAMVASDPGTYESAMAEIRMFLEGAAQPEVPLDVEGEIGRILRELGMSQHVLGYQYNVEAIRLVVENRNLINKITSGLYCMVAETFGSTQSKTERAIRHAIELAWDRGDIEVIRKYFGNTVSPGKGRPTNGEFIACVSDHVRRRLRGTVS